MRPTGPPARLAPSAAATIANPRWLLVAALILLVLSMADHARRGPVALAAAPYHLAWGAYYDQLVRRGRAPSTIQQYRFRLNTWVGWLKHPPRGRHRKDWWEAGPDDLDSFLRRACQPKALNAGQPLSRATRAMYSRAVPPLYRAAYAKGLIDADAFAGYIPLAGPRPTPRPLDLGDVEALLRYTQDHPDPRLHLGVALCYYDLARSGEPTELTVDDLLLGGGVPRINVLSKGRDQREWFPLHRAVLPALLPYLAWLAARHQVSDWRDLPAGTPLFQSLTRIGAPIGRSRLGRLLAAAMRDAGVPGRPHDLRRTAANQIAEAYADNPGPLRFALRHSGYSALEAYRVVSLARGQQYLEQVPDLLSPSLTNPL